MRVHVVSEHELMRIALRSVLKKLGSGVIVEECGKIEEGVECQGPFDLIVLDYGISMTSAQPIDDLRTRHPTTPVVILAEVYTRQDVVEAFGAGASGLMPRGMGALSLLRALQLVLSGEPYGPPLLYQEENGSGAINHNSRGIQGSPLEALTPRETDVLSHLLRGLSNKGIARNLNVEETTIKLHMKGILRKLGAINRTEAVRIAVKYGASLEADREQ